MIAWALRFCYNSRNSHEKRTGELVADEIDKTEIFVLKLVQNEAFGLDTKQISSLNTFVDKFGLIRLKTRVTERLDTEDFRLPILLPGEHFIVHKLILSLHKSSCHIGTQGLLSLLREKYWTFGGRRIVRSILKECGVCKRQEEKSFEVQMPPLPADRVRDTTAFEISGADLAGPLYLKSGEKAWICLFTCGVYRAVYLELVTSLSTNAFIQSFRRFVARRGRPRIVYSDNGIRDCV
ncbi:uncharacterized protein [Diabrotica undecimpunctata]|uniref:uncharacterized protein n=1 Tax=Diabrotica undecimpunctata TaxID=50387 RepID=UPI003B63A4F3